MATKCIRRRTIASCPRWDRCNLARMAFLRCSGIASLLSMITQLFTTAALVQNWAIYDPNLLNDVTFLLMMARFMGPRNLSSSVSSVWWSASNSPGKPTMSFRVLDRRGFPPLMSRTPSFAIACPSAGLDKRYILRASSSWACPAFRVFVRAATNLVFAARSLIRLCFLSWSILDTLPSWRDRRGVRGHGREKFGELTRKVSTNDSMSVCSAVEYRIVFELIETIVVFISFMLMLFGSVFFILVRDTGSRGDCFVRFQVGDNDFGALVGIDDF